MGEETYYEDVVKDIMKILSVVHWFLVEFEDKDLVSDI